jgi:uncharacterized membrane protein YadS
MTTRSTLAKALVLLAVMFAVTPLATPGLALAVGLAIALTVGNPWPAATRTVSRPLLQVSVVLLGFGTNLVVMVNAARHGLVIAAATIAFTFALGAALRRTLQLQRSTATLLSAGTAICGGSAIAAVAVATDAAEAEVSVAMGTVFLLNAVALYAFPVLGHALGLSQVEFGTWAGIAIHDISSVVAAASAYGHDALQTATVVKLSRTLWIMPVALAAHSDEAVLAVAWIFLVHLFYAHLAPSIFPFNTSIFTGKVPLERYREEHPLELETTETPIAVYQAERVARRAADQGHDRAGAAHRARPQGLVDAVGSPGGRPEALGGTTARARRRRVGDRLGPGLRPGLRRLAEGDHRDPTRRGALGREGVVVADREVLRGRRPVDGRGPDGL